jgi:hypothetical protein
MAAFFVIKKNWAIKKLRTARGQLRDRRVAVRL